MRNYLYSLLLLLLATSSVYGQELVATINGTNFHLGDELTIGLPSSSDNTYRSLRTRAELKLPPFTKAKLKRHIGKNRYGQPDTLYFLSHPQFPQDRILINLEEATENGEIIVAPIQHQVLYPEAVELRPIDCIPALIKAGYRSYTDKMIKLYIEAKGDTKRFNAIMSSPFEYQRQKPALLEELQKAVEHFDLNKVYYVKESVSAEKYDFENSGYPLHLSDYRDNAFIDLGYWRRIYFFSEGNKTIDFVEVPADRAESFEKRSRTLVEKAHPLYSKIYIRLLPNQGEGEPEEKDYDFLRVQVHADYLGADLYEYPHCAYYHLGSAAAKAKAEAVEEAEEEAETKAETETKTQ